ncbi:GNAT family N-acetyltransferase [Sphingobacterium thermophilum]|uniref:GNAT family N-acetyltransferase n=1 Tax=Sphingobacterium thermophilum TaxID=768534 RepID=A0ABP8R946_9SPHI
MLEIRIAALEEASIIHELAHKIYFPTYTGILSEDQMEFMLEKSYTVTAIQQSIQHGQLFYIAYEENVPVGFIALTNKNENILRIEKLYLLPSSQGKGFGGLMISFAEEEAAQRGRDTLELNVNRGNKAYYFYLKQGFEVVEEVDIPYYGYILDDYVMQKKITL